VALVTAPSSFRREAVMVVAGLFSTDLSAAAYQGPCGVATILFMKKLLLLIVVAALATVAAKKVRSA
jgi:hypothetical protein